MEIGELIISIISGIVGGNIAGAAMKEKTLGIIGNSISGLVGGGIGGFILQALDVFQKLGDQAGASGLDLNSVLGNIGGGGVSGAILTIIVAFIKSAMTKKSS